jgi:hypothetical protein
MQKVILSLVLCFSLPAALVAMASDVSAELADRLVSPDGNVTELVKQVLSASGVKVENAQLGTVVDATQQTWVKKDWKFEPANVADAAKVKELLKVLTSTSAGNVSPHILCQGGGLGSMVQTFAALNMLAQEHKIKNVTCFCPSFPLDENGLDDYRALLEIVGRNPKEVKQVPANHKELVTFLKERVYPDLKDTSIDVKSSLSMSDWAKKQADEFTLVGPTQQVSYHLAAIKAKCPKLSVVGLRTVSQSAATILEGFYRDASHPDQQLAARLNILARELYFIKKSREVN